MHIEQVSDTAKKKIRIDRQLSRETIARTEPIDEPLAQFFSLSRFYQDR